MTNFKKVDIKNLLKSSFKKYITKYFRLPQVQFIHPEYMQQGFPEINVEFHFIGKIKTVKDFLPIGSFCIKTDVIRF